MRRIILSAALVGLIFVLALSLSHPFFSAAGAARAAPLDPVPLGVSPFIAIPNDNFQTPEKVALGRRLFFDRQLSEDGSVACASCHRPESSFSDQRVTAVGIYGRKGRRNTPSLTNVAFAEELFWDGRASSLEDQAIQPLTNPREMGEALEGALSYLRREPSYRQQFENAFGSSGITARRLGKALAAYQRSLLSGNSSYDRYKHLRERHAMSDAARRGYALFKGKARCAFCHEEPLFTDGKTHNTGVGWNRAPIDLGRYEWTGKEEDKGRFKTPSLRNVSLTAPYMHDGSLKSLEEVVEFYVRGGEPNPHRDSALRSLDLSQSERSDLVAFLTSLTGAPDENIAQSP